MVKMDDIYYYRMRNPNHMKYSLHNYKLKILKSQFSYNVSVAHIHLYKYILSTIVDIKLVLVCGEWGLL
jgi:hypothetical protein